MPCALRKATLLWFPLSPTVGITVLEAPEPDLFIPAAIAQILNQHSWEYAAAHLGGSPDVALDMALGQPPGTFTWQP